MLWIRRFSSGRESTTASKLKKHGKSQSEKTLPVLERLEGPGGYLLSLKDHVCAPQKSYLLKKMYLTQPSENYKCLKANLKDHGPGSETSTLNSILEQLNQQMRVMSGDGVGEWNNRLYHHFPTALNEPLIRHEIFDWESYERVGGKEREEANILNLMRDSNLTLNWVEHFNM